MMINKRLLGLLNDSKKYVAGNVIFQWISLCANIAIVFAVTYFLEMIFNKNTNKISIILTVVITLISVLIRFICSIIASKMSYLSSKSVKKTLRSKIYEKLLQLGPSYNEQVKTSEIVQVAVEGVDQLDTYFGAYLPQFFYAMLAPLTLFVVLCFVNAPSAVVLLVCVPLIPVSIVIVQKWAKKLLSKYWGQYTALGDTFLENLQGLTTLKIYKADEFKNKEMNDQSEKFRKITMKVLTMQLNSITIMDLIAYGGAALGVILSVTQFKAGKITLFGALFIILISADFFIPMRRLGSFFHIAMNGMAASDKIFNLLDLTVPNNGDKEFEKNRDIVLKNVSFSYDGKREVLSNVNMTFPKQGIVCIAGESGCGKSTVASILTGKNKGYKGFIKIGETELKDISTESLMKNITYISFGSYLFKGTVRDNLLMGNPDAQDDMLWNVLEKVKLSQFLKSENGLDTIVTEKGENFSGGQRQRLALARVLLHDSPVYIFDEATSNIDVESENDIMEQIYQLSKTKCVILISHRLANTQNADNIYVLDNGKIKEKGTYDSLMSSNGVFADMCSAQLKLENYAGGDLDE